jgi:PAS domain S-box-containing protein
MTPQSAGAASVPSAALRDIPAPLERCCGALFESDLLGIYISRADGSLVACNTAFARMLGFRSVAEAIGSNMSAVYADATEREAFLGRVCEHGRLEHHRGTLRRQDGRVIEVIETVVGEFDDRNVLVELHGFIVDVTVSVEAGAAALVERERQFRAVFVDAADAMVMLDDRRMIVEANPAACAMFGIDPRDAAAGAPDGVARLALDDILVDGAEPLAVAWRELLAFGETKREHRVRSQGGVVRLIECSYRARVHAGRHLCIARDITDRKRLEERLAQSEKMESVGRLAGGIAHDFNNLPTAILGYTELLLGNRAPDDPERGDLEEIDKAGKRAAALTQQLLAFSRKQVLMPKDVDLNRTVASVRTMLARLIREDISLVYELSPVPAVVRVDPTQIEQAVLNLVLNARDALPAGGHIRLEVARVRQSQVEAPPDVQATSPEYVRLRVVDNGVGIPPEVRAHLFEPFYTTKEVGKGTGLGLASVYGIVRQSHGFISVDSQPGAGTVVTMYFPATAPTSVGDPVATLGPALAPGSETILLVEDDDAVRVIVSAALKRNGYNVLESATPRGACDIFDRHASDIDLLLTDVVMPEMNGPALAQRFINIRPELRVLFISGYTDVAVPVDASNPNLGFLSKPFQASTLTTKVKEMLARSARRHP